MVIKKAETPEIFQKKALEFVINKKSRSCTLHRKNGCSNATFFAKYTDFNSIDAAINSNEIFTPCKNCFAKDKFPLEENLPTAKDLCKQAIKALYVSQIDVARRLFERFVELEPNQPIGYVGLATVEAIPDDAIIRKYCDMMSPAFQMTCAPEYEEDMRRLVNFCLDKDRMTILMYATFIGEIETVRFLIRMGADVNQKSAFHTTALWYIAYKPLKGKEKEKREIAKLLLENGAYADVTHKHCVSLYNEYTDAVIAKMIKAKYPSLDLGYAPAIDEPEPSQNKLTREEKRVFWGFVAFVVAAIVLIYLIISGMTGDSNWSDLSDTEKENAKWANDVMEEMDNYR